MGRAIDGTRHAKRRKKTLKLAKGYWGTRKSNYSIARNAVQKALSYAYRDRRNKKREFSKLWNIRINAGVQKMGMNYSSFMHALRLSGVKLNRKTLAYLAVNDFSTFEQVVKAVSQ